MIFWQGVLSNFEEVAEKKEMKEGQIRDWKLERFYEEIIFHKDLKGEMQFLHAENIEKECLCLP